MGPSADPVLCSLFAEPQQHWSLDRTGQARTGFVPESGRRPFMLINPVPDDEKPGTMQLASGEMQLNDGYERVPSVEVTARSSRPGCPRT